MNDEVKLTSSWDRERVYKIISNMLDNPSLGGIYPTTECYDALEALLREVRDEAIAWTWAEACSQYTKGLDPRRWEMSLLLDKSKEDLNPDRD